MVIKSTNITDFICFIHSLIHNGETSIRVMTSSKKRPPNIRIKNEGTPYTEFTFVIFSPLYQVVYSDKVLNDDYDKIFDALCDYRYKNDQFRIQEFENIKLDSTTYTHITVEKELKVI